jgi:hypothetical protein
VIDILEFLESIYTDAMLPLISFNPVQPCYRRDSTGAATELRSPLLLGCGDCLGALIWIN